MELSYQSEENRSASKDESSFAGSTQPSGTVMTTDRLRWLILIGLCLTVMVITLSTGVSFKNLPHDAPLLADSTLGELAQWMADQSTQPAPQSVLGKLAKNLAIQRGDESLGVDVLLEIMQIIVLLWGVVIAVLVAVGLVTAWQKSKWTRWAFLSALLGLDTLLFIIPALPDDSTLLLTASTVFLLLVVMAVAPGHIGKVVGFFIVLSSILVIWEVVKFAAEGGAYQITISQPGWEYTTYPTQEDALAALENGEVDAIIIDRKDVRDLIQPYPAGSTTLESNLYPQLRLMEQIQRTASILSLPITPEVPGRLSIVLRESDTNRWQNAFELMDSSVAAVADSYADQQYLRAPRNLVLLDLKIFNDLNLPHVQTIAEALFQPARRNGSLLLIRILGDAAVYTWQEAILGFIFGSCLGLFLGTIFAHSALLERAILPYVVASQTVPILAIAPMVVIWLGASTVSVSVIAAYITFFPVTINTLRGMLSPQPTQIELMRSYGANWRDILLKLRFPAALPYIFTALKVSATASVVGAIIGELPSGISDGLGRAILNFSSDYSLVSTPKLWAAILVAACVGIFFFVAVTVAESLLLRRYIRSA